MPRVNQKHEWIKMNVRNGEYSSQPQSDGIVESLLSQNPICPKHLRCIMCSEDKECEFSYKSKKGNICGITDRYKSHNITGRICKTCIQKIAGGKLEIDFNIQKELNYEDKFIHAHIQICQAKECLNCERAFKYFND